MPREHWVCGVISGLGVFNHSGLRVIRSTGVHRIQNFALAVYIAFSGVEGQSFLA